ncbi:4-hydroxybenzoate polyprenyltransferase [Cordyceps militaris]|uniref:4-hydroxybenzoate polyprenyltransferase n=1 Tax=Cordyceps militaris TaxID=73501 RepID=A0A2H4SS71_CORMI|nr:4-hydroxybenzoate polyprenyltransferase [Cordyceps militaris]
MSCTKTISVTAAAAAPGSESRLAQKFGGHYASDWMSQLPSSWTPYIQLARLHRPHGLIVVSLSHLFGVLLAAARQHASPADTARVGGIVLLGALFCNSGAHAWNDLVDAPIDAQVERTRTRPIPRGAVTPAAALLFAASQAVLAAGCLLLLLPAGARAPAVPTVAAILYYPFAKRQMFAPQLVLGACMGLAVLVGAAAMGMREAWMDPAARCLAAATALWAVLFDTIYAHMDLKDDVKLGVNSLAVFVQGYARPVLALLGVGVSTLLYRAGVHAGMGAAYYGISVAACSVCIAGIVGLLDLEDRASCGKFCIFGFRFTGVAIVGGLLVTYLTSL